MESAETFEAEDLLVGRIIDTGEYEVSAEEIIAFARQWDPLPIHVDPEFAERGPFHGLIGSGAHAIAIMVRLAALAVHSRSTILAGRGMDGVTFHRPLRPGVVRGTLTIVDNVPRARGGAVITMRNELHDASGELVCDMVGSGVWR